MDDVELLAALRQLGSPRILVVGDLILDRYTWGDAQRISQEAPVVVLQADRHEHRLGGAANVAHMAAALGARVACVGVAGSDETAGVLRGLLAEQGIDAQSVLADADRPTSLKERFMGRAAGRHANQMLRVDTESTQPLPAALHRQALAALQERIPQSDAVLVADYAKGVCSPELLAAAIRLARTHDVPLLVDPGRSRPLSLYRGAALVKPNRREAELATGLRLERPEDALEAAERICREQDLRWACVTLDADGIALGDPSGLRRHFPTRARKVYDITGAGDMVLAMLGVCLAERAAVETAVQLANVAAGLEVERTGVVPIRPAEIENKLQEDAPTGRRKQVTLPEAAKVAAQLRARGQRVVLTNGCFDLLHVGHVTYLEQASRLGDVLMVAVNSDASVRRIKGPQRPVIGQHDRAAMLAALACVDYVLVFDQDTPHAVLEAVRPDVLVKGGTYTPDQVVGHEVVRAYGGQVAVTGVVGGVSTTQILGQVSARIAAEAA